MEPLHDPIVVVGFDVRLPGADNGAEAFEHLLFEGKSAFGPLAKDRFDADLYFDPKRGEVGKTYTTLGGCVTEEAYGRLAHEIDRLGTYDLSHRHFAEVAWSSWNKSGASKVSSLAARCGIFVGHSGGTEHGGALAMATLAQTVAENLKSLPAFTRLPIATQQRIVQGLSDSIRDNRPRRMGDEIHFNAYSAAALAAKLLGLGGPREVIDAACASSLLALQHALLTIAHGRIDAAIVGGATFNNVDNLILFSQSQACSERGSCPFDEQASGLVSSEGYVAVVIMRESLAIAHNLTIHGVVRGVGVASDGKGKSLWAPRTEGQQLAIRRAYRDDNVLSIDYQEAHATSTQVGDATELTSLAAIREGNATPQLLVGSVKSNLGHTLEAAGLVGLVKVLIALRRESIPPSINLTEPTSMFAWANTGIQVVTRPTPWKRKATPRRAAVNAFGIGGLNAHALIEEASYPTHSLNRQRVSSTSSNGQHESRGTSINQEPIAIVGRGLVLAGARGVEAFKSLMLSSDTAIDQAPPGRWLNLAGIQSHASPSTFATPTHVGGYIRDYTFDGQKYRIPPKQVRLANPAQMMLIDAVSQAINERDGGSWNGDRTRMGIVVGTIFGGEFSNQLQVGLRLPEILERLGSQLQRQGIRGDVEESIVADYRRALLEFHSAILDETGSFTASTLASRIAKTFDLMGGACAVDADDASGGLALLLATDQLRSGMLDTVICGVAQRSLDLVAFEQLDLKGHLVRSGSIDDIPDDCSRVLPGEGVAVVMLERMSDAVRNGRTILGVIEDVQCGHSADPQAMRRESLGASPLNREIVSRVGYLAGAHPVIRLISETLKNEQPTHASRSITSVAEDGFFVEVELQTNQTRDKQRDTTTLAPGIRMESGPVSVPSTPAAHLSRFTHSSLTSGSMFTLRIEANTEHEFAERLARLTQSLDLDVEPRSFTRSSVYRAAAVGNTKHELIEAVVAIEKAWKKNVRVQAFPKQRAVLCNTLGSRNRIGWVFPGQGSQYASIPQVISEDPSAQEHMRLFDELLAGMGQPSISSDLDDKQKRLGRDVWWTQLWVLAVSSTLADALTRHGHQPNVVLGHSFGECGAALHAGSMSLEQAIRFAKLRSDAVVMTVRSSGQLLSVRAEPSQVAAVLHESRIDCCITHQNAPNQTVVAGEVAETERARKRFAELGLASLVIPVPAAFHTPMMAGAERVLSSGFNSERIRPPRCAFLSATSTTYLSEPNDVRDALVHQLTQPVLYAGAVKRMVDDGCGLLIEVGPSDVLTRLNQTTVGDDAICLSLDSHHGTHAERLAWIDAVVECVSGQSHTRALVPATVIASTRSEHVSPTPHRNGHVEASENSIEIVDVTARSRREAKGVETQTRSERKPVPTTKLTPAVRVVDAGKNGHSQTVNPPIPQSQPVAVASPSPQATPSNDLVRQFLVDIVVELTGYHPDVIDFTADLEAELGVDSIKKAQVIGELAEWASLELNLRDMRLADFNTLEDIATLVPDAGMQAGVGSNAVAMLSVTQPGWSEPHVEVSHQETNDFDLAGSIESLMIDFVVDQTGYDPEVIDLDADLESELGIDSIKKAQLLGELQEQYDLRNVELGRLSLSDFTNLRSILEFVVQECAAETGSPVAQQATHSVVARNGSSKNEPQGDDFLRGQTTGQLKKNDIRERLRSRVDSYAKDDSRWIAQLAGDELGPGTPASDVSTQWLEGLAAGAGVLVESLVTTLPSPTTIASSCEDASATVDDFVEDVYVPASGTCRFLLEMASRPRRSGLPSVPTFHGDALVMGQNPIADALVARLEQEGVRVHRVPTLACSEDVDAWLDDVWLEQETPHLFLTTTHDADALQSLDTEHWASRRSTAISHVFRLCQRWMQRMIDKGLMGRASLVTVTNAGGRLGFGSKVASPESGGLAGLTKAMLIESWMRGFRETPMKVIEPAQGCGPHDFVTGLLKELAAPSYDEEVIVNANDRWTVRAKYRPLAPIDRTIPQPPNAHITRGGTWVVSGGGRGITAMTAMELAARHGLRLVMLGTAPHPSIDAATRKRAIENRSQLRRDVMLLAQQSGENPIETWRDMEKALEIDITLDECARRGIDARYECVDVSDAYAVDEVLKRVRKTMGEIRGVIHGAGAGQDARFDRKRADKVEKCIRAKVDGCIALASATRHDPLEWFIGFGSISGRFGANGHTDYSLANDMLAKSINRMSTDRPNVKCVTFHWHAWGDIGMAAKPEAKLALEMIGMQFMPAEEGLHHFLGEIEAGGDSPEVLITDRTYVRKFFPDVESHPSSGTTAPLLDPSGRGSSLGAKEFGPSLFQVTLDPTTDRFLAEHRVSGRPTLPFVIALEMMAEAAAVSAPGRAVVACQQAKAIQALKFASDDAMAVEIRRGESTASQSSNRSQWSLTADLRRKDGRLVEEGRKFFEASFETASHKPIKKLSLPIESSWNFEAIEYLPADALVYHGEPLQSLREIAIGEREALGRIASPSPAHLGGENRPLAGWIIPCAAMDAVLYAAAMLAYHESGKPSLPVMFETIEIGRFPDPGEPLWVHIRCEDKDASGMTLTADLAGQNGDQLLSLRGYRVGWIR